MNIFCDFDGVLVDFETGFYELYGKRHDSVPEGVMWSIIMKNPKHWESLPWMHNARTLWNLIEPHGAQILTGCPRSGYEAANLGKRKWGGRELGEHVNIITCLTRDKSTHMIQPGDVLIDDMAKNCQRWTDAGGHAIRHITVEDTIAQLLELGIK